MTSFKYILGIDSSTSVLRVGLLMPDGKVISRESADRFRHAEFIFRLIEDVLKAASVAKESISAIVVSTGPGSFTGLRVGMSAAKGMAAALDIPIVGITSYQALATDIYKKLGRTAILIPSRRDEYYLGFIEGPIFDVENIEVIRGGDILSRLKGAHLMPLDFDASILELPNIRVIPATEYVVGIDGLLQSGLKKLKDQGADNLSSLEPFYVQIFRAKKPQ